LVDGPLPVVLFRGFGFLSPANAATVLALTVRAFAVASAIYLIIELSMLSTGAFRVSPAALEQTIDAIDR
jgi:hypothetical protein